MPGAHIHKICAACEKEFYVFPSRSTQLYCSVKCSPNRQGNKVAKICEQCGKEYQVRKYRASTSRFCGFSCSGKWSLSVRTMCNPNLAGNTHRKGHRPANAFTSEQVRGENSPSWKSPIECACIECNRAFYLPPHQVGVGTHKGIYCSAECRAENFKRERSGENHPRWVGGIQTYRGRNWKRVRLLAVVRDNGACQKCGRVIGKSIPVHHKRPFREFVTAEEANQLENLICLCQSCHMQVEHSKKEFAPAHRPRVPLQ